MSTLKASQSAAMVLNLRNNSEKEAIIKSIRASGEFEIHDEDGLITIMFKEATPSKTFVFHNQALHKLRIIKRKKHSSILERVAKSQNITLAEPDSLDAVCAGVIV